MLMAFLHTCGVDSGQCSLYTVFRHGCRAAKGSRCLLLPHTHCWWYKAQPDPGNTLVVL